MAVLLVAGSVWAQSEAETDSIHYFVPDMEHIRKVMNDPDCPQYYPKLAKRIKNADTSLRIEDLQVLYYGRALMDDYSPYSSPKGYDEIRQLLGQRDLSEKETRKLIKLAESMADADPSEPRAYWYQFIGHSIMAERYGGDTLSLSRTATQFNMAMASFCRSGNGTDFKHAIHVISTAHEYLVVQFCDLEATHQELLFDDGHTYDRLKVASARNVEDAEEDTLDAQYMYFNIDLIWKKNLSMISEIRENEVDDEITLDLGTRFVLELKKTDKKKSTFRIVSTETLDGVLDADDSTLFPAEIPEGQIIGYFCMAKVYSSGSNPCLICKGNINPSILYMDTEIMYENAQGFVSTSNEGLIRMAKGVEIWNNPLRKIRISKIRTKR